MSSSSEDGDEGSSETWEAESVHGVRLRNSSWEFRIRWTDFSEDEDTWEGLESVCHLDIVRDFVTERLKDAKKKGKIDLIQHLTKVKWHLDTEREKVPTEQARELKDISWEEKRYCETDSLKEKTEAHEQEMTEKSPFSPPVAASSEPEQTSSEASFEIPERLEQNIRTVFEQRYHVQSTAVEAREGSPEIPMDPRRPQLSLVAASAESRSPSPEYGMPEKRYCIQSDEYQSDGSSETEPEYAVRRVIGVKGVAPERRFCVLWEDYGSDEETWEPESGVGHLDIVKEYLASQHNTSNNPVLISRKSLETPSVSKQHYERGHFEREINKQLHRSKRSFNETDRVRKLRKEKVIGGDDLLHERINLIVPRTSFIGFKIPRRQESSKEDSKTAKYINKDSDTTLTDSEIAQAFQREDVKLFKLIMHSNTQPDTSRVPAQPEPCETILPKFTATTPAVDRLDSVIKRMSYLKIKTHNRFGKSRKEYVEPPMVTPAEHVLETSGRSKYSTKAFIRRQEIIHSNSGYFETAIYPCYAKKTVHLKVGQPLDPNDTSKEMSDFLRRQFKNAAVLQHLGHDVQQFLKDNARQLSRQRCRKEVTRPRRC